MAFKLMEYRLFHIFILFLCLQSVISSTSPPPQATDRQTTSNSATDISGTQPTVSVPNVRTDSTTDGGNTVTVVTGTDAFTTSQDRRTQDVSTATVPNRVTDVLTTNQINDTQTFTTGSDRGTQMSITGERRTDVMMTTTGAPRNDTGISSFLSTFYYGPVSFRTRVFSSC